jgi:hypothetical protein
MLLSAVSEPFPSGEHQILRQVLAGKPVVTAAFRARRPSMSQKAVAVACNLATGFRTVQALVPSRPCFALHKRAFRKRGSQW